MSTPEDDVQLFYNTFKLTGEKPSWAELAVLMGMNKGAVYVSLEFSLCPQPLILLL